MGFCVVVSWHPQKNRCTSRHPNNYRCKTPDTRINPNEYGSESESGSVSGCKSSFGSGSVSESGSVSGSLSGSKSESGSESDFDFGSRSETWSKFKCVSDSQSDSDSGFKSYTRPIIHVVPSCNHELTQSFNHLLHSFNHVAHSAHSLRPTYFIQSKIYSCTHSIHSNPFPFLFTFQISFRIIINHPFLKSAAEGVLQLKGSRVLGTESTQN